MISKNITYYIENFSKLSWNERKENAIIFKSEGKKMAGYLIKDTTREERQQIVDEALGNMNGSCDGCMVGLAEMYQQYVEGIKEIRDINMEFNARYARGNMERGGHGGCGMG